MPEPITKKRELVFWLLHSRNWHNISIQATLDQVSFLIMLEGRGTVISLIYLKGLQIISFSNNSLPYSRIRRS